MRRLTIREVNELHGGRLPPDATLRPDKEPAPTPPTAKAKRRAVRGERFPVFNAFVDCSMAKLTGAEVKVWNTLFRDTKAVTGTARTGQADIARRAGLSLRAVKLAVQTLRAKGVIELVRLGRLNSGPSVYRVRATGSHGAM